MDSNRANATSSSVLHSTSHLFNTTVQYHTHIPNVLMDGTMEQQQQIDTYIGPAEYPAGANSQMHYGLATARSPRQAQMGTDALM